MTLNRTLQLIIIAMVLTLIIGWFCTSPDRFDTEPSGIEYDFDPSMPLA